MSKELVQTTGTELAVFSNDDFAAAGPQQDTSKNDIMIPKLILMQGMSPKVLEGEAAFGELRDTLDNRVMAAMAAGKKEAKSLEILPFYWEKFWIIKRQNGDKWDTETVVKMDKSNMNIDQYAAWTGPDNILRKRVYLQMFYVLIKGEDLPYTLGFKGSSSEAGRALYTQMYVRNLSVKSDNMWERSAMARWMTLTPVKITKKDNTFASLEVRASTKATLEEACLGLKWCKAVSSGAVKSEASDEAEISGEF